MGRASKDKRDIYYRKAKEEGFRARSAYKLLQIHEEFDILNERDITVGAIDLCAAPGSWSQVLAAHFKKIEATRTKHSSLDNTTSETHVKPRIVAVDLQEMAPIDGVQILQGDITSEATANRIIEMLNSTSEDEAKHESARDPNDLSGGDSSGKASDEQQKVKKQKTEQAMTTQTRNLRKADIVVCDGAPDVTGMHELDEYLQHQLLLAALTITTFVLRDGGTFVTKMFRGPNTPFLIAKSELFFKQVRVVKPKSSRNASMESFLVCQGFAVPPGYVPRFLNSSKNHSATVLEKVDEEMPQPSADSLLHAQSASAAAVDENGSCFTPDAPPYRYTIAHSSIADSEKEQTNNNNNSNKKNYHLLPFLSCGDLSGFDADMCYNRTKGTAVLAPVQPPLEAPYLKTEGEKTKQQ